MLFFCSTARRIHKGWRCGVIQSSEAWKLEAKARDSRGNSDHRLGTWRGVARIVGRTVVLLAELVAPAVVVVKIASTAVVKASTTSTRSVGSDTTTNGYTKVSNGRQ
jgi:hypothetical protein